MKVSALIPTYNRRTYVLRAIKSVLAQTAPVDEIIVVDDGSTDGTADAILAQHGDRVRLIRQANAGVSGARQLAVREARSEWVAFLDSDDEWSPDRNRLFIEATRSVPHGVAWIFGDIRLIQDGGHDETIFKKFGLGLEQGLQIFENTLTVHHPFQFGLLQGSMIRRAALLEVNAFGAGLNHSEDYLAGIQIACRYRFAAIQSVVSQLYRTSDLKATSLDLAGRNGPDYHRARMIAFSLIIQTGQKGPWGQLHAHAVRGYCKALAEEGKSVRGISLEQFRYDFSGKSLAFSCAAILGKPGIKVWEKVGNGCRAVLAGHASDDVSHGLGWNS